MKRINKFTKKKKKKNKFFLILIYFVNIHYLKEKVKDILVQKKKKMKRSTNEN